MLWKRAGLLLCYLFSLARVRIPQEAFYLIFDIFYCFCVVCCCYMYLFVCFVCLFFVGFLCVFCLFVF